MKKSLLTFSALILVFAIGFTACGNGKEQIKDSNGNVHQVVTDKKGNYVQDEYGYLMEVVTDSDGKTRTQSYEFPPVVTNKAGTYVENAAIRMNIPHGWYNSGLDHKIVLWHTGECSKSGSSKCEIRFSYDLQLVAESVYEKHLKEIKPLYDVNAIEKLNAYEKEVLDHKAKICYFHATSTDFSNYTFFIQNGPFAVKIEIYADENCYNEDQLIALLNANCVLKDLGGKEPETTTSTTTNN